MLPKDTPEKALLSFVVRLGKPCSPGQGARHRTGAEQSIAPTESSHGCRAAPTRSWRELQGCSVMEDHSETMLKG